MNGRFEASFFLSYISGNVILHHRHIRDVLIRNWSPPMDAITATIWASQATIPHGRPGTRQPGIAEAHAEGQPPVMRSRRACGR